ncbi:MAG TPA: hypothetical protein ENH11_09260, partial [Candidatus Acetothermia bacterium]|nr:hypothetical protein [Candidatus Acetothermia bacterium]
MDDSQEVNTVRTCIGCGEIAPELSERRRICDVCHKHDNEARARPHIETSVQRRKKEDNAIGDMFNEEWLDRVRRAKRHDTNKRRGRQESIRKWRIKEEMAKINDKLPKALPYQMDTVLDHHYELSQLLVDNMCSGGTLTQRKLQVVADDIHHVIGVKRNMLIQMLEPYAARDFTRKEMERLARMMAGNYLTMRKGIPPKAWTSNDELEEWALIKVKDSSSNYSDLQGNPGFMLAVEIFTGALAGTVITAGYSGGVEARFARKLGINLRNVAFFSHKLLVQLEGWAFLCTSSMRQPRPRTLGATSRQRASNKGLVAERFDISKCVHSLKPEVYATFANCPIGYQQVPLGQRIKRCRLAVRSTT